MSDYEIVTRQDFSDVTYLLEVRHPLMAKAATGVVARLAEPPPGPRVAAVALHAAGPQAARESALSWGAFRAPVDPAVEPRRWVRDLDARELRAIEEQAADEAGQLNDALRRFESRLEPDVASWHAEWLGLCHRRDDLEGVLEPLIGGGELAVGIANSLTWDLAGPDRDSTLTILDFGMVQPLLRLAGRERVLEQLTLSERLLLANVRQMERYRRHATTN